MPEGSDDDGAWGHSSPALSFDAGAPPAPEGRYVREGLLGFGGMGRVHQAVDTQLDREVAIKENTAGEAGARRLLREARITARLEHPGIVPIHEMGRTPAGEPWYAMRIIRGRTLAAALEGLDASGRLGLLRRVLAACEAVAYAHNQGVIHRDLKPANIMLGAFGETMVLDWGLARVLGESDPGEATLTQAGSVLGTPAYMSPEQARGEPLDARSDVWSLGICLIELVTGAPPYAGSSDAIFHRVAAGQPPQLSEDEAPPALAAIARRATRPDPAERYPDAGALARDLAAWLDGARVEAHAYSLAEQVEQTVDRWRAPLMGLAGLLVAGLVASLFFSVQVAQERDRALEAEAELTTARAESDAGLSAALASHAVFAARSGLRAEAETLAAEALLAAPSPRARGALAAVLAQPAPRLVADAAGPDCGALALSPDGEAVACLTDGRLRLLDSQPPFAERWRREVVATRIDWYSPDAMVLSSEAGPYTLLDPSQNTVLVHTVTTQGGRSVQGAPGELRVLGHGVWGKQRRRASPVDALPRVTALATCADGVEWFVGPEGGVFRMGPGGPEEVVRVAMGDAQARWARCVGGRLLLGGQRGQVALVDLARGAVELERSLAVGPVVDLAMDAHGTRLVAVGESGAASVISVPEGRLIARLPHDGVRHAQLSADGGHLQTLGERARLWDLPAAPLPAPLHSAHGITDIALHPDGDTVWASTGGGTLLRWTGDAPPVERTLDTVVLKSLALAPGGERLLVAKARTPGVLWAPTDGGPTVRVDASIARRAAVLSDGTVLAAGWGPGPAVHDPAGTPLREHMQAGTVFLDIAVPPDADHAVLSDAEGGLWRFSVSEGMQRLHVLPGATHVAVAADGRIAASVGDAVVVHGADPAAPPLRIQTPAPVQEVAFGPAGRLLATGHRDGRVHVWQAEDGALLASLEGHRERVPAVRFSADGQTLYTASWDGRVRRWHTGAFHRPAEALHAEATARWGMDAAAALATVSAQAH